MCHFNDGLALEHLLQVPGRIEGDNASLVYYTDSIAQKLGLLHVVGREDHCDALLGKG